MLARVALEWSCTASLCACLGAATVQAQAQPPANYRTRQSVCRYEASQGTPLSLRRRDSSITTQASAATKVTSYSTSGAGLAGGEVAVCTEYGRVEIADSDDDQVRIQLRFDATGDGTSNPEASARRAIEQTTMRVHASAHQGRLVVRVWNDTLGFTEGTAQPVLVGIRVHVPASGSYRLMTEAYHGSIAVRRLALAGGQIRGRVGEKFKGIPGYIGTLELDNVLLGGDLEITSDGGALSAPLLAKLRIVASSKLTVASGSDLNIAIAPEPGLGIRAFVASGDGAASILMADAAKRDTTVTFTSYALMEQSHFSAAPLRLDVRATTVRGRVHLAAVASAPPAR